MTSREVTDFLPRAMGEVSLHPIADRAMVILFGAIQWPWLLRSLSGGSKAEKAALLARLELPGDALPNLGSWKADTGLLTLLADHVLSAKPKTVVEFGTGASSLILGRALALAGGGELVSFDQHGDFVEATKAWLAEHDVAADIRTAPLKPSPRGWSGLWYDHGPLPEAIDMLVVDGPPWTIHPFTRGAAESLFERITPGGAVFLDDAARPGERFVASVWRRRWPDFDFRLVKSGTKGTLVGVRRG